MGRMERDKFMSPQEAKELGLIDNVLEHPPQSVSENEKSDCVGDSVKQNQSAC